MRIFDPARYELKVVRQVNVMTIIGFINIPLVDISHINSPIIILRYPLTTVGSRDNLYRIFFLSFLLFLLFVY
jgi:hypothetical protein